MVEIFEESRQVYGANKTHAKFKLLGSTLSIPSRANINCYMHEIGINSIITTGFNVKNKTEKKQKFIHNNYLQYWKSDQPGRTL